MTEENYQRIVQACRDTDAHKRLNVSAVSRLTGNARDTVVKAWQKGWPKLGMVPVGQLLGITKASVTICDDTLRDTTSPIVQGSVVASEPGPAVASKPETPSPTAALTPHVIPSGLSTAQANAAEHEARALATLMNNATGGAVIVGKLLAGIQSRIEKMLAAVDAEDPNERMDPKMALQLMKALTDLIRAHGQSAEAIAKLQASRRLNVGQVQSLTGSHHLHHHNVDVSVGAAPPQDEAAIARARQLAASYVRLSAPLEYDGAEEGIVDAEATEIDDASDL